MNQIKKMTVNIPDHEYDICLCGIENAGRLIDSKYKKIFIITDKNVEKLYSQKLATALEQCGFAVCVISVEPGEDSKSMIVLEGVYSQLLQNGITRKDLIIALGGGVVGDLTGFAAATLLRGIDFVQIPTTLLAQVDSSVGGKVAVNLREGKNLAGAFYEPKLVIIDTTCLNTLSDRQFADGMAEVIKYGAIIDEKLFFDLENGGAREQLDIADIIYRSVDIKRKIVEQDEKEANIRMLLNFGHTYGHAVEKYFNFKKYMHGESVAIGMIQICDYSEKIGITEKGTTQRIKSLLLKFGLPTQIDDLTLDIGRKIFSLIKYDKKSEGEIVNLVLLNKIGKSFIQKTAPNDFERVILGE